MCLKKCNHSLLNSRTFHHPERHPVPISSHSPHLPHPRTSQAPFLFWACQTWALTPRVAACVWFPPEVPWARVLSPGMWRLTAAGAGDAPSQGRTHVHLFTVHGHLGVPTFWLLRDDAAQNGTAASLCGCVFSWLLGLRPGVGLLSGVAELSWQLWVSLVIKCLWRRWLYPGERTQGGLGLGGVHGAVGEMERHTLGRWHWCWGAMGGFELGGGSRQVGVIPGPFSERLGPLGVVGSGLGR